MESFSSYCLSHTKIFDRGKYSNIYNFFYIKDTVVLGEKEFIKLFLLVSLVTVIHVTSRVGKVIGCHLDFTDEEKLSQDKI